MKSNNHNIDNLFAQKLASLEDSPSEDAWLAIGKGLAQKQKKKKAIWFPYTAAAAVALLIVSTIWMRKQAEIPDTAVAQNPVRPSKAQQITLPAQPEKRARKQPDNSYVADQNTQKQKARVQPEETQYRENPVVKKLENPLFAQQTKTEKEMALLPVVDEKIADVIPAQERFPVNIISPSNTIVVTVALNEADAVPEPEDGDEPVIEKQSKAGKLLSKLKQLKKGEFDELGIRKETLVAFVKEKTHNIKSQSDSQE